MTPPNDQQFSVDEMERLHREATPGPWAGEIWLDINFGGFAAVGPRSRATDGEGCCWSGCEPDCPHAKAALRDADLSVYLRNNTEEILRRLRRAERVEEAAAKLMAEIKIMVSLPLEKYPYHPYFEAKCALAAALEGE